MPLGLVLGCPPSAGDGDLVTLIAKVCPKIPILVKIASILNSQGLGPIPDILVKVDVLEAKLLDKLLLALDAEGRGHSHKSGGSNKYLHYFV